jgi:hypothetical protein
MSLRQRRRLGQMADRLNGSKFLTDEDQAYLVNIFRDIADGANPNHALGLSRTRGDKQLNESKRANFARMFHWIIGAMQDAPNGYGLKVGKAIEAASALSRNESWNSLKSDLVLKPLAEKVFDYTTNESLRAAWYNKKYDDLKKLDVCEGEYDFPYHDHLSE